MFWVVWQFMGKPPLKIKELKLSIRIFITFFMCYMDCGGSVLQKCENNADKCAFYWCNLLKMQKYIFVVLIFRGFLCIGFDDAIDGSIRKVSFYEYWCAGNEYQLDFSSGMMRDSFDSEKFSLLIRRILENEIFEGHPRRQKLNTNRKYKF